MVRLFDQCLESVIEKHPASALRAIARACWASDWDVLPDQWTPRQIEEALHGTAPAWVEREGKLVPLHKGASR